MNALANPLVSSLVGGVLYLAVTAVLMIRGYIPPPPEKPHVEVSVQTGLEGMPPANMDPKNPPPSWSYFNPDVEYLVKELREQKGRLATKETELRELEARIAAERLELSSVTNLVYRMRAEIESSIGRMKDDEVANIKRLGKMYAGMEPAAASKVLMELEPDMTTKILHTMKDDVAAGLLDAMSKVNAEGVKRAAEITRRLRLMQSSDKK